MRKWLIVLCVGVAFGDLAVGQTNPAAQDAGNEWQTFGHDKGGLRFSPLTQITPANVNRLQPAWVFHMKPPAAPGSSAAAPAFVQSEVTPLVAGGVMYVGTPYGRVVALDPVDGTVIWSYTLPDGRRPSTRGVEYFPGDAQTPPQIMFGSDNGPPAKLFSLNAKTGIPNPAFGSGGSIDLATPEHNNAVSSPPIVYRNLVIIGSRHAGYVRAWNVHTGALVWTFKSVPQGGEPYNNTWAGDSSKSLDGANPWSLITVDTARGLVFMTFAASPAARTGPGDYLFRSSVVAADANTGKYRWHFQLTRHDVFDNDAPVPPVLFDVRRGGRTIPAVAAMNKQGLLFILDRLTGEPLYGVEERPVPQNPEAFTSPTQPFPLKPRPLVRMEMSMADIATVTPELEAECKRLIAEQKTQMGGAYFRGSGPSTRFPGTLGGPNWGATTFNPQLGYLFVASSNLGAGSLSEAGRFKEPKSNMMCQQPPWGILTAVDVNTAEVVWEVPLGVSDNAPPGKQNTGRPLLGGPINTASGLIFVGATDDARFRALDAKTGKELWAYKLAAPAHSVPSTYLGRNGKQYVVISSTGGSFLRSPLADDSITAFALPN